MRTTAFWALHLLLLCPAAAFAQQSAHQACVKQAIVQMDGKFTVSGKAIDETGTLAPFEDKYEVVESKQGILDYYVAGKKVGTWTLSNDKYTFVIYDDGGREIGPFDVGIQCHVTAPLAHRLTEQWTAVQKEGEPTWEYLQERRVQDHLVETDVLVRAKDAPEPPVLVSSTVARKVAPPADSPSGPEETQP